MKASKPDGVEFHCFTLIDASSARCVDPENATWKIQFHTSIASVIKFHLDKRGISYEDNFHQKAK